MISELTMLTILRFMGMSRREANNASHRYMKEHSNEYIYMSDVREIWRRHEQEQTWKQG